MMLAPRVVVISGSDSSGDAGLEVDRKVLEAYGVQAQTVTTALSTSNTVGTTDVHIVPTSFLASQIDSCFSHVGCDIVKIGMLASTATTQTIADKLTEWGRKRSVGAGRVVLDPIMTSTDGAQSLPGDAVRAMIDMLVINAEVVTPGVPEAILMLKESGGGGDDIPTPTDLEGLKALARMFYEQLRPKTVLLKGGHVPPKGESGKSDELAPVVDGASVADVFYDGHDFEILQSAPIHDRIAHGTRCNLSSSIAAHLAKDLDLRHAVREAVHDGLVGVHTDIYPGHTSNSTDRCRTVQILPFVEGHFLDYLLDRKDVKPIWERYIHHPFAESMGNGSLHIDDFRHYLIQDYLYLTQYARTNALAAYKSADIETIAACAQTVVFTEREMRLHLEYCSEFGLTKQDVLRQTESLPCTAYSRYVLDIGQSQDWLALQISLAPCLLGYGQAAKHLHDLYHGRHEGKRYWKWVQNYMTDEYLEAVKVGSALIEKHMIRQSPSRVEELAQIFVRATELEIQFWDFNSRATDNRASLTRY